MKKQLIIPPVSNRTPIPVSTLRREKINRDIAEFLSRGGKITQVPTTRSKYNPTGANSE